MTLEKNRKWLDTPAPSLSVVMIGHRSASLLKRAITSLQRTTGASLQWELVLIVNGECEEVADFARSIAQEEALPVAIVKIPECRPGAARNSGVRVARASLLFFLDDDIESFQDILSAAVKLFRDPEIEAAGGANLTPPNSGALARATGGMMASVLGAASMRQRYRVMEAGPACEHGLILCNLAVRKNVFDAEKGFAAHLISNEENVLLQRLAARNAKLWSSPELAVYHCRRDSWSGLLSQASKYGGGRAQNLILAPHTWKALYFLPSLFLIYLSLLPLVLTYLGEAALAPLVLYFLLALASSLRSVFTLRDPAQLLGLIVFPCVHLSYGFGFMRAIGRWWHRWEKLQEHVI